MLAIELAWRLANLGKKNEYMLTIRGSNNVFDAMKWNSGRFSNHCCKPNAEFCIVDLSYDELKVVFLKALQDIKACEEVTVYYDRGEHDGSSTVVSECTAATRSGRVGIRN